jgi:hypothetical protein
VVVVRGPGPGQCAELPVLADGGPLCVAPVFSWVENRRYQGLYFIYQKVCGVRIGPYYPHIPFAVKGMKTALGLGRHVWENGLSWYEENRWVGAWVAKHLGGPHELRGGQWVGPDGKPITPEEFSARQRRG